MSEYRLLRALKLLTMIKSEIDDILRFDDINEVEDTFFDDEDSIENHQTVIYVENQWPKEDPTGFSFKSKKRAFDRVCETLKVLLRKGSEKTIDNISFKVLDSTKSSYGIDYEVEIEKGNEKGIALLKIFGPNNNN